MTLFLKWFAILWTTFAVAVVVVSNLMIVNGWPAILGLPIDVRSGLRVALLLAPGAVAALVQLVLGKRKNRQTS